MKLIFALDLIRHGHRAPLQDIPKVSNIWSKADLGKLMEIGATKAELLGQKLRQYYIEKTKLLPHKYDSKAMQVRSTDTSRTKDTAAALLKGLYPKDARQIKVICLPDTKDELLMNQKQLAHTQALKRLIKESEDKFLHSKNALYRNARKELKLVNELFGTELKSAEDFVYLGDLLFISTIHDKPLLKKLGADNITRIIKAADKVLRNLFNQKQIALIYAKNFVTHLIELIESQAYSTVDPRYILYAGHDVNIWTIAALLQKPIRNETPYLSNLRFELFRTKQMDAFVKVSLNGKAVKIHKNKSRCPAPMFIEFLRKIVE